MWAAYNGRSYSQQGRPESEQTSSNVGIDGLAPHDDAVYNKVRASPSKPVIHSLTSSVPLPADTKDPLSHWHPREGR